MIAKFRITFSRYEKTVFFVIITTFLATILGLAVQSPEVTAFASAGFVFSLVCLGGRILVNRLDHD